MLSNNTKIAALDGETQELIDIYGIIPVFLDKPYVKEFFKNQMKNVEDQEATNLLNSFMKNTFSKLVKISVDELDPSTIFFRMRVDYGFRTFRVLSWSILLDALMSDDDFKDSVEQCRKSLPFQINFLMERSEKKLETINSLTFKKIDRKYITSKIAGIDFTSNVDVDNGLIQEIRYDFTLNYLRECIGKDVKDRAGADKLFQEQVSSFCEKYFNDEILKCFTVKFKHNVEFCEQCLMPLENEEAGLKELAIELADNFIHPTEIEIGRLREKVKLITATVGKQSEQLEKQSKQLEKQSEQLEKQSEQLEKQDHLIQQLFLLIRSPDSQPENQTTQSSGFFNKG